MVLSCWFRTSGELARAAGGAASCGACSGRGRFGACRCLAGGTKARFLAAMAMAWRAGRGVVPTGGARPQASAAVGGRVRVGDLPGSSGRPPGELPYGTRLRSAL